MWRSMRASAAFRALLAAAAVGLSCCAMSCEPERAPVPKPEVAGDPVPWWATVEGKGSVVFLLDMNEGYNEPIHTCIRTEIALGVIRSIQRFSGEVQFAVVFPERQGVRPRVVPTPPVFAPTRPSGPQLAKGGQARLSATEELLKARAVSAPHEVLPAFEQALDLLSEAPEGDTVLVLVSDAGPDDVDAMLSTLRKSDPKGRIRVCTYYVQVHEHNLEAIEDSMKAIAQAGRGEYRRIAWP